MKNTNELMNQMLFQRSSGFAGNVGNALGDKGLKLPSSGFGGFGDDDCSTLIGSLYMGASLFIHIQSLFELPDERTHLS